MTTIVGLLLLYSTCANEKIFGFHDKQFEIFTIPELRKSCCSCSFC